MSVTNDNRPVERPKLFTFVGSAFLAILRSASILPRGVYLILDAEDELEDIKLENDEDHKFYTFPVASKVVQDFVDA